MDIRAVPGAADADVYPIEKARQTWLELSGELPVLAEIILARHLPPAKAISGTVDDITYDRLPAFLAECRAELGLRPALRAAGRRP